MRFGEQESFYFPVLFRFRTYCCDRTHALRGRLIRFASTDNLYSTPKNDEIAAYCMKFRIQKLREDGKLIPLWNHAFHSGVCCDVDIRSRFIPSFNRHVRIARARPIEPLTHPGHAIPDLFDVQFLEMCHGYFILEGFENARDLTPGKAIRYGQAWKVYPIEDEPEWGPSTATPRCCE